MKVIYCHHGNRKINGKPNQEDDLSVLGQKDAKLVSKLLDKANGNIKCIYTSPFYRCMKTAKIINKRLNLKITPDERLNEFQSIPNESWKSFLTRTIDFLKEKNNHFLPDDIIICVTSGLNLSGFICWSFNLLPSDDIPKIIVPSCSPMMF